MICTFSELEQVLTRNPEVTKNTRKHVKVDLGHVKVDLGHVKVDLGHVFTGMQITSLHRHRY